MSSSPESLREWVFSITGTFSLKEYVGFESNELSDEERLMVLIYYIVSRQKYDPKKLNKKQKFYVSFIKKSMEKMFNEFEFDFHWIELWDMC